MRSLGFLPLRAGSKGIIGKNKRKMLGRPLFCWVLTEAMFSNLDEIVVYTDDRDIISFIEREYHWTSKITIVERSSESATDTASTEKAIFAFIDGINVDFDIFCLLQATSPFTKSNDIDRCLQKIREGSDSALSVVNTHRFIWKRDGKALNYKPEDRPRRQDFDGLLVENGAVYCTSREALLKSRCRISGNIAPVEMSGLSYTEVDTEADWNIVEQLIADDLRGRKKTGRIAQLILDVDGVFTDGKVLYSENGELAKSFDMRDGMGLEILRQHQVEVAVMTSEKSALVAARMKKLNIDKVYLGVKDKFGLLQQLLNDSELKAENLAYLGDDVNDMANMCRVGWSLAPSNAMEEIKKIADISLSCASGAGAIREACHFILKYNKRFE